jgi:hypothetical protein
MGNFSSKEDILVEIAVLFKQMDNGQLTLEELEELVTLSRDLHERTLILRYKAFEEKVFGVRLVKVEEPNSDEEMSMTEQSIEIIEEPAPIIEVIEETIPEIEIPLVEEPIFQVEVKDEPTFGFSLFDNHIEEEEKVEVPVVHIEPIIESTPKVEIAEEIHNEIKEEAAQSTERQISDVERAHAENLARFFNKTQENPVVETPIERAPVAPSPSAPQFERIQSTFTPTIEPIKEIPADELDEKFLEEISREAVYEAPVIEPVATIIEPDEVIQEFTTKEPVQEINIQDEKEEVGESSAFSYGDLAVYFHKFNQVDSNLASQFGVVRIDTLIGSFGLNERLQFINELFDGSSENFSNAIKTLDILSSKDIARTKVAEFAVTNNWDVESDTVVEFMQKIIRRYA